MEKREIQHIIDLIDGILSKHFSRENDERHYDPWNYDIKDPHNTLGDPQEPHGDRVGKRRMATALTALKRRRGVASIPKFAKLIELSTEQLNSLGEKHFGDEWPKALDEIAGGAGENMDVKDVPDEALATEDKGPVDPQADKARETLKDLARRADLSVKDVEALSDEEVLRMVRQLG